MRLLFLSLLVATAIGVLVRLRDGRFRTVNPTEVSPLASFASGEHATFVQFSSQTCSTCPRSLALLRDVADQVDDVDVVELSAENHMDLVQVLDVRRSPTVFLLDAHGAVHARTSGAMHADHARAAIAELVERKPHVRT